jgi:hypothetical protein
MRAKYQVCNIRLTKNKPYWENQLEEFSNRFIGKYWGNKNSYAQGREIVSLYFGKQDIRGGNSICLVNSNGTISRQKHFESKDIMLGYIEGWNASGNNDINKFY